MLRPAVPNVPKAGGIITELFCAKQPPEPPGPVPAANCAAVCTPLRLATVSGPKALAAAKQAVANAIACADPGRKFTKPAGVVCVQETLVGTLKSEIALRQ